MKIHLLVYSVFFTTSSVMMSGNANEESSAPTIMDTISHRHLTVEDVQSMPFFSDIYRRKESNDPKIGSSLHDLISAESRGLATNDYIVKHGLIINESKSVLVEVVGDTIDNIEEILSRNGYSSTDCYKHMCSLYIAIDEITKVARLPQVTSVRAHLFFPQGVKSNSEATKRSRNLQVGRITTEGIVAHNIDKARVKYNVNGTGILIGVLGVSLNCRNTSAVNDTISGDLPENIIIVGAINSTDCLDGSSRDDGRANIQTLYDIAPGARFAFYGLGGSRIPGVFDARMAKGIKALADAGCDIIIDGQDVGSVDEMFFQHGPAAQAVDDAVTRGIIYYAFATYYQTGVAWDAPSGFVPSGISPPNSTGQFHLFGNRSDGAPIISQRVGFRNGVAGPEIIVFQWDQPSFKSSGPPGCQSDLDIILSINGTVLGAGTDSNIGGEPGEGLFVVPLLSGSQNVTVFYDMFIIHKSGPFPKFMKIIVSPSSQVVPLYEFPTNSTTIVGKANSAFGTSVGGVRWNNTPAFGVSPPNLDGLRLPSYGIGNPIVFDRFGNRYPVPIERSTVRFRAATGTTTTLSVNNSGVATAHAAGISALMLQAKGGPKSLTPQQVTQFLEQTAIDMDDPYTPGFDVGFDNATGFGFIDALAALDAATATKAPTKSPTKAPTKKPTKAPTKTPSKEPTEEPTPAPVNEPTEAPQREPCGLFGLSFFCPFTLCGFFGRLFNLCSE